MCMMSYALTEHMTNDATAPFCEAKWSIYNLVYIRPGCCPDRAPRGTAKASGCPDRAVMSAGTVLKMGYRITATAPHFMKPVLSF